MIGQLGQFVNTFELHEINNHSEHFTIKYFPSPSKNSYSPI